MPKADGIPMYKTDAFSVGPHSYTTPLVLAYRVMADKTTKLLAWEELRMWTSSVNNAISDRSMDRIQSRASAHSLFHTRA